MDRTANPDECIERGVRVLVESSGAFYCRYIENEANSKWAC